MLDAFATAGKAALACLAILAFAALAIMGANLGVGLSAGSLRSAPDFSSAPNFSSAPDFSSALPPPSATPADIVAARFPSAEDAVEPPVTFSAASLIPATEHRDTFDLGALSGMATVQPSWPATDDPAPADAATGQSAAETARQAGSGPAHRGTARSSNVLNDAQIASIKRRLKLTAEQERMWPAVETALRKIVYTKSAMNPTRGGQSGGSPVVYIDPTSAEVRELKSAALPLLMRLNDEQKREVKMLAYVMGLEAVASQF